MKIALELGFDGIMTVCVFAWEERAAESSRHNLAEIRRRTEAGAADRSPGSGGAVAYRGTR
jgi:hypothetical protein